MKLIESKEDLESWENYVDCMKLHLKQLDAAGGPCFISKDKVDFDMDGDTWTGYAVLAGPKGEIAARKLKTQGLTFREGTCSRDGKELRIAGLDPKFVKGASKTIKKLLLGYKVAGGEEDGEDGAAPEGAAPEARAKRAQELQKLSGDLDRLLAALNKK
jgi:hypothetical protein